MPVHCCNDRLLEGVERQDAVDEPLQEAGHRFAVEQDELLQVESRREELARRRQHHAAHAGIFPHSTKRRRQRIDQLGIDRVAVFTIEPDRGEPVVDFETEGCTHAKPPWPMTGVAILSRLCRPVICARAAESDRTRCRW